MLLYWIADIGIVFHCKHNNNIHSYIQSLNPILKILKFKMKKMKELLSLMIKWEQVSSGISDLVKVSLSVGHKSAVQRYIQFSDTFWRFLSIIK